MKKLITAVFLYAVLGLNSAARATNYSNEVLAIGVGARPLGMGGAFVGLADDSSAVYWNPAGLPHIDHVEVAAVQQGQEVDALNLNAVGSRYTFISGGWTVPQLGTFGIGFLRFGVGDIPFVSATLNPDGSPNQQGTFNTQDLAFMGSYGRKIWPYLSAGATIKYLTGGTSGLPTGDTTYNYFGLDLGIQSDLGQLQPALDGLTFGLNLQDGLNTGVMWSNSPTNAVDSVDVNVKAGLAYLPNWSFLKNYQTKLAFLFDVDPKYSPNTLYHLGTEAWYRDTFAVRTGVRIFGGGQQSSEMSVGLSVRIYMLQVDYAFINYELTPVQYLSLSGKF